MTVSEYEKLRRRADSVINDNDIESSDITRIESRLNELLRLIKAYDANFSRVDEMVIAMQEMKMESLEDDIEYILSKYG